MPPTFIRVRDKATGHQYDVDERAFDEDAHSKVNASKQWPDLTGPGARPRPPKYSTDKAGQPATNPEGDAT